MNNRIKKLTNIFAEELKILLKPELIDPEVRITSGLNFQEYEPKLLELEEYLNGFKIQDRELREEELTLSFESIELELDKSIKKLPKSTILKDIQQKVKDIKEMAQDKGINQNLFEKAKEIMPQINQEINSNYSIYLNNVKIKYETLMNNIASFTVDARISNFSRVLNIAVEEKNKNSDGYEAMINQCDMEGSLANSSLYEYRNNRIKEITLFLDGEWSNAQDIESHKRTYEDDPKVIYGYKAETISPPLSDESLFLENSKYVLFQTGSGQKGLITRNPLIEFIDIIKILDYAMNIVVVSEELWKLYLQNKGTSIVYGDEDASVHLLSLLEKAIETKASDIIITHKEDNAEVEFITQGITLKDESTLNHIQADNLFSVIKAQAGLSETPGIELKGKMAFVIKNSKTEFRVAMEKQGNLRYYAAIRVLERLDDTKTFSSLGYLEEHTDLLTTLFALKEGMILISGVTGSGKTTSLAIGLNQMVKKTNKNTLTIEDPIEISNPRIKQFQIVEGGNGTYQKTGKDYSNFFLRAAPQAILVGEIRDKESIDIAVKLATTGHVTFATIHAETVSGTFARLKREDVPKEDLQDSLKGIVAQSLEHTLCDKCKIKTERINGTFNNKDITISKGLIDLIKLKKEVSLGYSDEEKNKDIEKYKDLDFYIPNPEGCSHCELTPGFYGRTPIYEIGYFYSTLETKFDKGKFTHITMAEVAEEKYILGLLSLNDIKETLRTN